MIPVEDNNDAITDKEYEELLSMTRYVDSFPLSTVAKMPDDDKNLRFGIYQEKFINVE